MSYNFSNCNNFNIFLWFLINLIDDDAFISAVTANVCFTVHLVCLFMKTYLLVLLQGNCLELFCCAFLHKLFGCMRNMTAFCQHLLKPICFGPYWYICKTHFGLSLMATLWEFFVCDPIHLLLRIQFDFLMTCVHFLYENHLSFVDETMKRVVSEKLFIAKVTYWRHLCWRHKQ